MIAIFDRIIFLIHELFYTCCCSVMDMLRFHKFTIGHAWTTDFGCADKKDEFDYIIK